MKRIFKKAMSILFAVLMVFGIIGNIGFETSAATITDYEVGDIIEFGWYPQSKVTDESLVATLNEIDGEWISYGYYSGTGRWYDGQMKSGDYMRYMDVVCNSEKFRGVVFDTYRPCYPGEETSTSSTHNTFQDDNGYTIGIVYWFKYEPIKWRVLDPNKGLVLSETIVDSQAYSNYILNSGTDEYGYGEYWGDSSKTYYANNYARSSIRKWLNNDFYNTAFSNAQKSIIDYTELDNSAYDDSYSIYDSETTYDKIYLISWDDALDMNYAFSSSNGIDTERKEQGTDYAKCQGLYVYSIGNNIHSGNSNWWLRSPGDYSDLSCNVYYDGSVGGHFGICSTNIGVRPAMSLNLKSDIFQSDILTTVPTEKPESNGDIAIRTPSTSKINYGETLILHTDSSKIPADAKIEWSVEGNGVTIEPSADGKTCAVTSKSTGDVTIVAKYVDADGVEHISEQEIKSNAGIWQKIVSFFKNLFGINRIIEQ